MGTFAVNVAECADEGSSQEIDLLRIMLCMQCTAGIPHDQLYDNVTFQFQVISKKDWICLHGIVI